MNNDDLIKSLEKMRKIHEESARAMSCAASQMALSRIQIPVVKIPEVTIPKINMPKVDMPKVNMPKIDMPKIIMPDITIMETAAKRALLSNCIKVPKIYLPSINVEQINYISELSKKMLKLSTQHNYAEMAKSMQSVTAIIQNTSSNLRKIQEAASLEINSSIGLVADIADFNNDVINHFTDDNADKLNNEIPESIENAFLEMYDEIACRLDKLEKKQGSNVGLTTKNVMTWLQLIVYTLSIIYNLVSPGSLTDIDIDAHKEINNYYYIVQDTDNSISEKLELTKNATMEEFDKQNELPQIIDEKIAATNKEVSADIQ